ncbi:ferredoxin-dependent glutamate synthase, chloroplastic [Dorcoceras hygrometricum]|uniref:Ferredoxin-dependent glutamate synthase, chloroplastic n=1 Tax=Dorcoceras hygrometricum TaxID=472368 RepID=A0A2Z7AGP3_9LAMI|nr:ferredoxin-dependent glutamate synthase, chloroplastic [Dorcoceras hygrometricum]
MSNVEQEADNSKRNSEESDVVLKNQQMVACTSRRKQQIIQSRASMNQLLLCIQSQDDVPVASYSASNRELKYQSQRFRRNAKKSEDWTAAKKK